MNIIKKIQKVLGLDSRIRLLHYKLKADLLTQKTLNCKDLGITEDLYDNKQVIVSLTSFGSRIKDVYLPIESIMQGSMKPNKIILWLAWDEKGHPLPTTLEKQIARGLEVKYTDDIRSYKKLIPTLQEHPDSIIITIDDDVIYNFDIVENLYLSYLENPECIHANRVHYVTINKKKRLTNYKTWKCNKKAGNVSSYNFMTGVGGVLYPPNCFNKEVFNKEIFFDICKYADDVWFYAMALHNNTKIKKAPTRNPNGIDYLYPADNQEFSLHHINVSKGRSLNDEQLEAVFSMYDLYKKLDSKSIDKKSTNTYYSTNENE